jgi:predicted nucleic acid-binding protein
LYIARESGPGGDHEDQRGEAEQIFRRHGRDRRLSFCDAISAVVVTTLLDQIPCLAFDEDFRSLGLTVIL